MIRRTHVIGALTGAAVVLAGFYLSGVDLSHRGVDAAFAYVCAIIGKLFGAGIGQMVQHAKDEAENASPGITAEMTSLPKDLKALADRVIQVEQRVVQGRPLDVAAITGALQAIGDMAKKVEAVEGRLSEVSLAAGLRPRTVSPLGAPDTVKP